MPDAHGTLNAVVLVGQAARRDEALVEPLADLAADVVWAQDLADAAALLEARRAELVILTEDVELDHALAFVERMSRSHPEAAVVVVAAQGSVGSAVRAVRAGAYDFIAGPLDRERLRRLAQGLESERLQPRGDRSRFFCDQCPAGVEFVGHSPGAVRALETIRLVSESRCNPILLLGETGSGKELAARAVHAWRSGSPDNFVDVNCASLTANLLESELFGHVKGAFTGADADKTGLFELAASGTIFLDEISEMPVDLQAKLLRALQEKAFRKVGGVRDIPCEATIVASSNRDLLAATQTGKFRRDLYYRLAVFPITLPPLRGEQRRDDILLLAEYFLGRLSRLTGRQAPALDEQARCKLLDHDWPGNVRELRNAIERALILERGDTVTAESLVLEDAASGAAGRAAGKSADGRADPSDFSLETAEREFILRALKETGWQRTRAAALLGITRATLHAKLKRYDIQPPPSARTTTRKS